MADSIDNLKIQIGADSKNAKDKIDSLVDSLAKLRMSLAGLDSASVNVSGINNAVTSFRNLGDAIKSVDTRQLGSISRSLMKVAKAGSVLSSASKGFSVLKANTKGLGELANVSTKKSTDEIEHEIQELSLLRDAANDTKETLRSMLDGLYIPSDFFKELGDDAKALRGYIGIGKTSYNGVAGANEVRNALQMAGEDANDIYNDTEAYIRLARVLQNASDRATECERQIADLNSQLRASKDDLMDMGDMGADLSEWEILSGAMDDTAQSAQNLGSVVQTVEGQNPFEGLVESLRGFSGLTIPAESIASITGLSNAVIRLNSVGGDPGAVLTSISNGLRGFGGDVQLPNLNGMAEFIKSLGKLSGKRVQTAVSSMPMLVEGLRKVSVIGDVKMPNMDGIVEFATALSRLGRKTVTQAVDNIPKLAKSVPQMVRAFSNVPQVNRNIIDMTNALANLGSQMGAFNTLSQRFTSSGNGISRLSNHFNRASKSGKGLAAVIGKVYATYWLLFRAFGMLKKSIDISADVTEVQNVVDTTFGKYSELVNKMAKTSIPEYGMSELTVKQTASRFQAMGKAMGIQNAAVKQATNFLAKNNAVYDVTGNKMADMSIELTKLTADLASFYNVEQDAVSEKLSAIFTGQTRPLRAFGMDLTQATLQEWALAQGMDVNIKKMSQAEKTLLRYQYVMSRSKDIMGDFSRTSDTWANQVRMLAQNFQQLGIVIGSGLIQALKPALRAMNAFLQKVISFAQQVVNALGKIFGWQLEMSAAGITDDLGESADSIGNLASGAGDAGDKLGGAADKAKDLKEQLEGFDKLNVITTPNDNSGGGGKGGSGGGGGGGAGDASDVKANLTKTEGFFDSSIKNLYQLGTAIADALSKAMGDIKWNKIYDKAKDFGTGLARFLNGLLKPKLFRHIGETFAGLLNTVIVAGLAFVKRFNWKQFGEALAAGVNGAVRKLKWKEAGQLIGKGITGALTTISTFLKATNWRRLGKGIQTFVANALKSVDWKKLGETFGNLAGAIFDFAQGLTGLKQSTLVGIAGGIGAIVTALAGFKAYKAITTGLTKILAKLGALGILDLAGTSTLLGGLEVAFSTLGPAAIIAAGAIGMVAQVLSDFWMTEGEINDILGPQFENQKTKADELRQSLEDLGGHFSTLKNDYDNTVSSAENNAKSTETLADAYFKLAKKSKLTKDEQKNLKAMAQELIKKYPELQDQYDATTGRINTTRKAVQKLINKEVEEAKTAAKKKMLTEAYEDYYKAVKNMKTAYKEYEKGMALAADKQRELDGLYRSGKLAPNEYAKATDALADKTKKNADNLKIASDQVDTYGEAINDITDDLYGYKDDLGALTEAQKSFNKTAEKTPKGMLDAAKKSEEFAKALDNVSGKAKDAKIDIGKLETSTKSDLEKMGLTYDSAKKKVAEYEKSLNVLSESGKADYQKLKRAVSDYEKNAKPPLKNSIKVTDEAKKAINDMAKANDKLDGAGKKVTSYGKTAKEGFDKSKTGAKGSKDGTDSVVAADKKLDSKKVTAYGKDAKAGFEKGAKGAKNLASESKTAKDNVDSLYTKSDKTFTIKRKGFSGFLDDLSKMVKGLGDLFKFNGKTVNVTTKTTSVKVKNNKKGVQEADGGIYFNDKWHKIQSYAQGGLPSSAQIFMAREAGPELVGTIGNHTAVMNNDQIVASVSNGVAQAMSQQNSILLKQNQLLAGILAKDTGILADDIFAVTRSKGAEYARRTGQQAYVF